MARFLATILTAAAIASGPGGKIKWTGCKTAEEFAAIQAGCRKTSRAMALYFRSDASEACRKLEADSFSNDEVAKAAERLVRVALESEAHPELLKRFRVKEVPTVLFLDPQGEEAGLLLWGPPDVLVEQFTLIADEFPPGLAWRSDRAAALKEAKEAGKPVAVFYRVPGAQTDAAMKVFGDAALKDFYGEFVWVRIDVDPSPKNLKELGLTADSALWILEPADPASPRKFTLPRKAAALKTDLQALLKARKAKR